MQWNPVLNAPDEIGLVRAILAAHQTAYAKFHNGEGYGVIEADTMAIGYASMELAKHLKAAEQRATRAALEAAAHEAEIAIAYDGRQVAKRIRSLAPELCLHGERGLQAAQAALSAPAQTPSEEER